MISKFYHLLPIILGIIVFEAMSQGSLKSYYLGRGNKYFILGLFGYLVVSILLTRSYKYDGMGEVNMLWSGLSVITILLVGYTIYGEKIHWHDFFALIFIMLGIVLIEYYN